MLCGFGLAVREPKFFGKQIMLDSSYCQNGYDVNISFCTQFMPGRLCLLNWSSYFYLFFFWGGGAKGTCMFHPFLLKIFRGIHTFLQIFARISIKDIFYNHPPLFLWIKEAHMFQPCQYAIESHLFSKWEKLARALSQIPVFGLIGWTLSWTSGLKLPSAAVKQMCEYYIPEM